MFAAQADSQEFQVRLAEIQLTLSNLDKIIKGAVFSPFTNW
jgi:hypothetical protein